MAMEDIRPEDTPHSDGVLLYTLAQVGARLQISEDWIRRRLYRREIACTRLGTQIRFTDGQVKAIVERHTQKPIRHPVYGMARNRL